jgi:hypothetical protein
MKTYASPTSLMLVVIVATQPASPHLVSTWNWLKEFCYPIRPLSHWACPRMMEGSKEEVMGGCRLHLNMPAKPPPSKCGRGASMGCRHPGTLDHRAHAPFSLIFVYIVSYILLSETSIQFARVSFFHTVHCQGMNCPHFPASLKWLPISSWPYYLSSRRAETSHFLGIEGQGLEESGSTPL